MTAAGESEGPPAWHDRLFAYQIQGAHFLASNPGALLADDMGLGKTIQAIAALRKLARDGATGATLIVVPASIIPQWRSQLYEWAPDLTFSTIRGPAQERAWKWRVPADIYLVGYETLRSDYTSNPHAPVAREWAVVVLDEAQRIKNRSSELARVCKSLKRQRAWALTGTPLENQLDDLASILEFTQPRTADIEPATLGTGPELFSRQQDTQLRRRKDDVLKDLPPKVRVTVPIELTTAQRRAYERAEREGIVELKSLGSRLSITHVLDLIVRLKQICNFCPLTGESAKLQDLHDRLEALSASGEKALVFSQFVGEPFGVNELARRLASFAPLVYSGEKSVTERGVIVERFKTDADRRVLLLSLRAGGLGLNLQEASYVFHFDQWWNPAAQVQAEDRAHRFGQASTVFVYTYVCIGTVEERIEEILGAKRALFANIVDASDLRKTLTSREILSLVGLDGERAPWLSRLGTTK